MATGIVTSIDMVGLGMITPDSRGELIGFDAIAVAEVVVGDRVWFLARMTHRGVNAHCVALLDGQR